jgi:hypothetical protein
MRLVAEDYYLQPILILLFVLLLMFVQTVKNVLKIRLRHQNFPILACILS